MTRLTLVSHHLCPYVQRAAVALAEKEVSFERLYVDLSNKPDWFRALSPLGKVPLLKVETDDRNPVILFESAVILEFLEETQAKPLHPVDPLARAHNRAWIEFGSAILNAIWRFYSAVSEQDFDRSVRTLGNMFQQVEDELGDGPWFSGTHFSMVDAVYGAIFRYFDRFDRIGEFGILTGKPKLKAWRDRLAGRPSVQGAVRADYSERLDRFLRTRGSILSEQMKRVA